MKKTGPRISFLLSLVLLFFSLLQGASVNAQNETPGKNTTGRAARSEKQSNAFAAFDSWASKFQSSASADARFGLAPEGLALAKQRRAALAELVKSDPARALALALPASAREKLPLQIANEMETTISGIGDLSVLGALQRSDGPRVQPVQRKVRINGKTYPAYVHGRKSAQTSKQGIPLRGILVDGAVALEDIAIEGDSSGPPANPPSAWTTGLKNVLVIRVDFSDLPGDPVGNNDTTPISNFDTVYTAAYVQGVADNRASPFYLQSSYGLTTLSNTVTTQLYRLPQTAASYAATAAGNDQLHDDAVAAAGADYNTANFDRIMVLFSYLGNLPNSVINYGGLAEIVGKRVWINGEFDFRVVTHELGHTYGLFHAGLWQVDDNNPISPNGFVVEYGDDFDTMGANFANDSRTDFNPYYKNLMGWLPDSKVQLANTNGSYRVYAFDSANYVAATNNPILALKFVKDNERTYWVGVRRNFTSNTSMNNGAYILWGFNSIGGGGGGGFQSGLLDLTTPGTAPAINLPSDYDAALAVGANFSDPLVNFSVTPLNGDNSTLNGYLDVQIGQGSSLTVFTNVITGGNGNGIIDFNECNNLTIVLTNTGLAASNITVSIATTTPQVIVAQSFSPYPTIPTNGTGANFIPFKLSTSPTFICGTPIDLELTIKSDVDTRTNFLRLPSGVTDVPLRFDNNTPVVIPDADPVGVSSPIVVSNFTSTIGKVTVALHITHTFDFDLQMELIAPDGTIVTLSQNNGGAGQNYGINCADPLRTRFDDDAIIPIGSANAPFVGLFKPDQPLANFNLKSGTNANGTWQLRVVDQIPFLTGSIQCWSLYLSPQNCHDGGGECPGSDLAVAMVGLPDPVVRGSNLTYTITVTNHGPSMAKGVVLSHTLPTGSTFVSATTSQGTSQQSGGTVTCNLGTIPARSSATATVVVIPLVEGTISSTAAVGSNQADPNPANNSVTISTRVVPPSADLSLTISDAPDPVAAGANLTYTITVTNRGPAAANGVILTNTLASTAAFVSASSTQGSFVNANGTIIYHLGTLLNGGGAVVTIVVRPTVVGTITETSRVISSQADLIPGNNVATATTTVSPAADLALSIVDTPDPVVTGSNVTYVITLTNRGASTATGVAINGTLPSSAFFVSNTISQGTFARNGNTFIASIGTLPSGSSATLMIEMTAPVIPQTLNLSATASASQADPNSTNNTATATTTVARPFVSIVQAGSTLTVESFAPANGSVDSGETVSVVLRLRNAGNVSTTNLVATLLSGGGVTPLSGAQTYGALTVGGNPVGNTFSFTASGGSGETITATLQLQDNAGPFTNVNFTFTLPTTTTFSNTNLITIPDSGPANPYPSEISVSGITGLVNKVTVSLNKINHTYPDDVDVLLVDPAGRKVLLMADAGGVNHLTDVILTLDSTAATTLSDTDQLVSGSFIPANYPPGDVFANAPLPPYETSLNVLNGTTPNGTWSLYIIDDTDGDAGSIAGGWSVAITTIAPVNQVAGLTIAAIGSPGAVLVNESISYTLTVANNGPDIANNVIVNNPLPPNTTAMTPTTFNLGSLGVGSNATVTVTLIPGAAGMLTNTATVSASEIDLNLFNNSASAVTSVGLPVADLSITASATANPIVGNSLTYTLTITNHGPNSALGVVVTNRLPTTTAFVSAIASQGTCLNSAGVVTCALGNIGAGNAVTISIITTPLAAGNITNSANVITGSNDPNNANNSASLVATVANPTPNIVASGSTLVSESGSANSALDPGELVQVSLALANTGSADTTNLKATLQATGGVNSPSAFQTYGALVHGGAAVSRMFSFTAASNGTTTVVATLQLEDGTNNLGTASFTFQLPKVNSFSNTGLISIPSSGPATPYPSTITISGQTGVVSKVTVTLNGLTHSFPDDLDMILVGPGAQKSVLMSDVGGGHSISNLSLVFDAIGLPISDSAKILPNTFSPTDFETGESLPPSAPAAPYAVSLSAFDGSTPNGVWSLYINDDTGADLGNISGGWSLALTTIVPIDLAEIPPCTLGAASMQPNGNFQFTLTGQAGLNYRIDASSNMTAWTPVKTNVAGVDGTYQYTDSAATNYNPRFYRAVRVP